MLLRRANEPVYEKARPLHKPRLLLQHHKGIFKLPIVVYTKQIMEKPLQARDELLSERIQQNIIREAMQLGDAGDYVDMLAVRSDCNVVWKLASQWLG